MLPTFGIVPTTDGPGGFLPEMPNALRQKGEFAKVPILAGVVDKEMSGSYSWGIRICISHKPIHISFDFNCVENITYVTKFDYCNFFKSI